MVRIGRINKLNIKMVLATIDESAYLDSFRDSKYSATLFLSTFEKSALAELENVIFLIGLFLIIQYHLCIK